MPDIIQLLPDAIANQIAAGEVVQRPASVVKELLENAIDAGADTITLIIREGGKALIQVIDNGSGMSETDVRLSLERHATSKIRSIDDLFTLQTMGFRGEALASIAAVSQMEIKTQMEGDELGTLLVVEGSDVKVQEPAACPRGTSISVKNLFFNIPARRNFLKSNPVELRHITDEFLRVALANPDVAFTLYQGDEPAYDLPRVPLAQRVVHVFGKSYKEQLATCVEETAYVKISGFIGKPGSAKKTRGEQYLFVNNRFVRNNYLHHAIMGAFEGLLQDGTFPFYVLFISIDPKHVDVNIHPTKTEVKFDDERAVYAVMKAAVHQSIAAHNLTPGLDFNDDVNLLSRFDQVPATEHGIFFEEQFQNALPRSNRENWMELFERDRPTENRLTQSADSQGTRNEIRRESTNEDQKQGFVVQLHNQYILCSVRKGLMVIDQQAAHERILYEKYLNQLNENRGESQQSLFPETVVLGAPDFTLIVEMEKELLALGFQFEIFGKNTLLIKGYPMGIEAGQGKILFEGLIEQFKRNQDTLSLPISENLARSLAKRTAIQRGKPLVREEMESLTSRLMACKSSIYSPDGKPTFHIFELSKLEEQFSRM